MKVYVGMANAVPDSLTPRRFIAIRNSTSEDRDRRLVALERRRWRPRRTATPDEIDTATVRT